MIVFDENIVLSKPTYFKQDETGFCLNQSEKRSREDPRIILVIGVEIGAYNNFSHLRRPPGPGVPNGGQTTIT